MLLPFCLVLDLQNQKPRHATDITPDEFRTIIAALQAAKLIILGDIEVDAKTCSECKSYFFTINKLLSTFEKQLLQE